MQIGRLNRFVPSGLLFACLLLLSPGRAAAYETDVIAGWEGDLGRGFGFLMVVPRFELSDRWSLIARVSANYMYYDFTDSIGRSAVSSPGAIGGLGLRLQTRRLVLALSPGWELRRNVQYPWGSSRGVVNWSGGFTAAADLYLEPSPLTSIIAGANYGHAMGWLWSRTTLRRQVTNTDFQKRVSLLIAADLAAQGNVDLQVYGAGGGLDVSFPEYRISIGARAGGTYQLLSDGSAQVVPYLSLAFFSRL